MTTDFETFGNATILFREAGRPVLATDPWLTGTCYYGSWGLQKQPTPEQIAAVCDSEYIWISHGHPDHLHRLSLDLLPRGKRILVPDHYLPDIADDLAAQGFAVTVMPYRKWFDLSPGISALCLDNENQDAILVVRAGEALVLNLNDSPLCGEDRYLRRLVRAHPNDRSFVLSLCAIDGDQFNTVLPDGSLAAGRPEERKKHSVWSVARRTAWLGARNFCCSSSQHIYVRADTAWINPYRITWQEMQQNWSRPAVRLIEPFVTIDTGSGCVVRNHPAQTADRDRISDRTGDDDPAETMAEADWRDLEGFLGQYRTLRPHIDWIGFEVGGETRRFAISRRGMRRPEARRRGILFHAPRHSLMQTVRGGFFDDLLISNVMKAEVFNVGLYPRFTPLIAKLGGNAGVRTWADLIRFHWRYFRRSPVPWMAFRLQRLWSAGLLPALKRLAGALGMGEFLRILWRRHIYGDPV